MGANTHWTVQMDQALEWSQSSTCTANAEPATLPHPIHPFHALPSHCFCPCQTLPDLPAPAGLHCSAVMPRKALAFSLTHQLSTLSQRPLWCFCGSFPSIWLGYKFVSMENWNVNCLLPMPVISPSLSPLSLHLLSLWSTFIWHLHGYSLLW